MVSCTSSRKPQLSEATQQAISVDISHKREAATAIAGRFASCELVSVQDTHRLPTATLQPRDADEGPRTTVRVQVVLHQNESAQPYFKEYANGTPYASEVTWLSPGVYATLPELDQPNQTYPAGNNLLTGPLPHIDEAALTQTTTADFYPLTAYAEGTEVTVWAGQGVEFADDSTQYHFSGLQACGGMVFLSGSWLYSAESPESGSRLSILSFPKN